MIVIMEAKSNKKVYRVKREHLRKVTQNINKTIKNEKI